MAYFAKVEGGIVTQVIRAEATFFDTFVDSSPGIWVQTSYNTQAGAHSDGGAGIRKNFAAVGYSYDSARDAFIPPSPGDGWQLDDDSCTWVPI